MTEPCDHHQRQRPRQPYAATCPLQCLKSYAWVPAYFILARELPRLLGRPATIGDLVSLCRQRRLRDISSIGPAEISQIEFWLVICGFDITPEAATH